MPLFVPRLFETDATGTSCNICARARGVFRRNSVQHVIRSDFDPHSIDEKLDILHDLRVTTVNDSLSIRRSVIPSGVIQDAIVNKFVVLFRNIEALSSSINADFSVVQSVGAADKPAKSNAIERCRPVEFIRIELDRARL